MESLVLAFEVVFPLFLLMTIGYVINLSKLCNEENFKVMNKLVFKVFLPVLLFYNVYKTDISEAVNPRLMLFCSVAVLCEFVFLMAFFPFIEKENKRMGVMIQGSFRSNFVLFGLPVTVSLLGEANSGVTSVLIALIVPIYNVLAVICLEIFRGGKFNRKKIITILKGIITNPLILSSVLGVLFLLLDVKLPGFVEKGVNDISKIATPLALIVLGGTFKFKKLSGNIIRVLIVTAFRLVIIPVITIFIAVKMGFAGAAVVALLSMFASPAATSSFTMAEQMGGDGELAGQIVVCTTLASIFTIFCFVATLNHFGII